MTKLSQKRKIKEKTVEDEEQQQELPPSTRSSDEPPPKKLRWTNKQRVLVFAARGISHRDRHLMEDLKTLMPHCRPENKMERRENLFVVNEICEMKNCNKAVLFEGRHQRDLYMWLSNVPMGPSAKFLVENVYTMAELKLTGNCLKGSRPLLSFDPTFDQYPHYNLLKEILVQIFGVPNHHPKSQPFFDHVMTFSVLDNRIWFRNYQILAEDGALAEIGPRFVLNPIKIFDGSFGGQTIWENPFYVSPAKYRRSLTKSAASKYLGRITKKAHDELNRPGKTYDLNETDDIFSGDVYEKADAIVEQQENVDTVQSSNIIKKQKKKKAKVGINSLSPSGTKKSPKKVKSSSTAKLIKSPKEKVVKVKKLKNKKIALMKVKKAQGKAKTSKAVVS